MFIPSQTEGKWWGKPFPPFGQFLEHLHHWSFARCLCKSTSHGCENDFMINAQRILKAIWSFVYYLERRKKGLWSRSTIRSNKMLKSFKSTSLSLAWRPKAKLLRETWSAGYWRAHFSSFLAILPLFCSRVLSKCSSSSSALDVRQTGKTELYFLLKGSADRSTRKLSGFPATMGGTKAPVHSDPRNKLTFYKLLVPLAGGFP